MQVAVVTVTRALALSSPLCPGIPGEVGASGLLSRGRPVESEADGRSWRRSGGRDISGTRAMLGQPGQGGSHVERR